MPLVPKVVDLTQPEAERKLLDVGLKLGTVEPVPSDKAEGKVVGTTPAAEVNVDSESKVNLQVSSGPAQQVKVPNLRSLTQPEAERKLQEVGFVVGAVEGRHNDLLPKGRIIGTDPTAGALASLGSPV